MNLGGDPVLLYLQKVLISTWFLLVLLSFPLVASAQNTSTLTSATTSTSLLDNPVFGCVPCANVNQAGPFPDRSAPIFSGDPLQSLLPTIIANGLPVDNQFGVGVPAGSSAFPISVSNPFALGTFLSTTNDFNIAPLSGGGANNTITMSINQVTPEGNFSGGDQEFDILFSIQSMTDPDGNLVGAATGVFTQTLDGVTTNGTIQFDSVNGFSGTNLHE